MRKILILITLLASACFEDVSDPESFENETEEASGTEGDDDDDDSSNEGGGSSLSSGGDDDDDDSTTTEGDDDDDDSASGDDDDDDETDGNEDPTLELGDPCHPFPEEHPGLGLLQCEDGLVCKYQSYDMNTEEATFECDEPGTKEWGDTTDNSAECYQGGAYHSSLFPEGVCEGELCCTQWCAPNGDDICPEGTACSGPGLTIKEAPNNTVISSCI